MILIPAIGSLVLIEWETKDEDDMLLALFNLLDGCMRPTKMRSYYQVTQIL